MSKQNVPSFEEVTNNIARRINSSEDLITEGIFDRIKSAAKGVGSGIKGAIKGAQGESTGSIGKDLKNVWNKGKQSFQYGRSNALVEQHTQKINNAIDDYLNDLKTLGKTGGGSEQNFNQIATFLKGIIAEISNKVGGNGNVTINDLKGALSKSGFLA